MKIVRLIDKAVDALSKGALLLSGILLLAMAINVTYGVLARYVFSAPSVYAMELTKILMIPALVLAVSYVQRYNRHLQVDFIATRLPKIFRLVVLDLIVPLAGLFVVVVMVWKGWESAIYSFTMHETSYSSWAEPLWPVRIMVPVGYALLGIIVATQVLKAVGQLLRINVTAVEDVKLAEVDAVAGVPQLAEVTVKSERV